MSNGNPKYLDFTQKPDFQQILTNPILDIAARFWEDDRYDAFRTCYRSMRVIDDLVDDRKSSGEPISESEKKRLALQLTGWFRAFSDRTPTDDFQQNLIDTAERFQIPDWPWRRLLEAMLYDLNNDGFSTLLSFRRYAEGAAVSPASVFMHLCGVTKGGSRFHAPDFDVRKAARPLALFSYLVHIIRDFQKDQLSNLNYFADDLVRDHSLDQRALKSVAEGQDIPQGFRSLIERYREFADYYRRTARKVIDRTLPQLLPPYQLSLEIIYSLYLQICERIDVEGGLFTTEELNPTPQQVSDRIYATVSQFKAVQ
ncbi:MAG: squalene/phytoene synthase family protein [Candidatus Zixiibacteriota bacterium]|nr:MAG: squalene/phytoene synthase family protein [candidate division Zixibacteria bacterium]